MNLTLNLLQSPQIPVLIDVFDYWMIIVFFRKSVTSTSKVELNCCCLIKYHGKDSSNGIKNNFVTIFIEKRQTGQNT